MRKVGLFEAKQKLSELVDEASQGERIGITRRGKLAAMIVPAARKPDLEMFFEAAERLRTRARRPRNFSAKKLVEEGRA